MPPHTYRRFIAQLHARGRGKADGFDRRHFDGLTPEERVEVGRLLRAALLSGDSTAVEGLRLFDAQ